MKQVSKEMLDRAEGAYYRATGNSPSRAGLRAALFSATAVEPLKEDEEWALKMAISHLKSLSLHISAEAMEAVLARFK